MVLTVIMESVFRDFSKWAHNKRWSRDTGVTVSLIYWIVPVSPQI